MSRMLREMSAKELVEWRSFALMEPFGEAQADYRAGVIAATIANSVRDPKRRPDAWVATDFMRDHTLTPDERTALAAPAEMTSEQLVGYIAMMNAIMGGSDQRVRESSAIDEHDAE